MKSILLSIKPKWVAKILNGEKTIEVRKRFPKDYEGWVYIYTTKDKTLYLDKAYKDYCIGLVKDYIKQNKIFETFNGKVVARFYCNKVDTIWWTPKQENPKDLFTKSCLTKEEIKTYLNGNVGYAIHISQLEIFDKPKELIRFYNFKDIYCNKCKYYQKKCKGNSSGMCRHSRVSLTKAPQSYMFIEVDV